MLRLRERVHLANLSRLKPDGLRGGPPRRLLGRVAPALPRHERPALRQEGRGVLDQDGQRGEGPGAHEIESALVPLLGADPDRSGVRGARRRHGALKERALARGALDERDGGTGHGEREGDPREACTAAEVTDAARSANRPELQGDQRVRDVRVEGRRGVADRRRRLGVVADELEQRSETGGLGRYQPEARSQGRQALRPRLRARRSYARLRRFASAAACASASQSVPEGVGAGVPVSASTCASSARPVFSAPDDQPAASSAAWT